MRRYGFQRFKLEVTLTFLMGGTDESRNARHEGCRRLCGCCLRRNEDTGAELPVERLRQRSAAHGRIENGLAEPDQDFLVCVRRHAGEWRSNPLRQPALYAGQQYS